MEITNSLIISILGGVILFFLGFISFYFWKNLKFQKERLNFERKIKEMDYDMKREDMYRYRMNSHREESEYNYLPKIVEEIPYLIEKAINNSQKQYQYELRKIIDSNFVNINSKISNINTKDETNLLSKQLIREISHSLNTPFSLIEVTVDNTLKEESTATIKDSLLTIKSSINICKSFMASFRELVLIASSSNVWNPDSLVGSIRSAFGMYRQKNNSVDNFIVRNLPEKINGFTNNYILSLLLPLLENAIESAVSKSNIEISYEKQENVIKLIVTNTPTSLPKTNEIYESGFTTKKNHEGLGLSTVKHLLESQHNSKLEHIIKDKNLSFIITLIGQN